jgi:uncharacterized OB-fold protein
MAGEVPVREGLFTGDGLIGGRCRACNHYHFPRAAGCPYCGGTDVEEATLSTTGLLWGWTAVTAPPPGYAGPVPFGFGIVELPEGVRVITRLGEADPARLAFGMAMRFELVPLDVDEQDRTVVTYSFTPGPPV